jgi:hypothetical protein
MAISIPLMIATGGQRLLSGMGSQVPGVTEEEQDRIRRYEEGVERARQVQGLYRRLGALGLQERAEAGMQSFDPRMAAIMGPAGLAGTRRLGQLGGIAGVSGEIEGRMKAEAIDPERKREVMRQRMLAAAATAAAAGQTKEQMFQTLSGMAGGDPDLLKEARSIAQAQGRMAQAGTIPGYVEDIGSLFKFG